jgi:hypothetical protein
MKLREAKVFLEKVKLCGCGTSNWPILLHLLEIAEDHEKNGLFYDPPEAPIRWLEFGAKVLDDWGLVEHGTGVGSAWLTEEGTALLAWLRRWGVDDSAWPDGWCDSIDCPCGCNDVVAY